MTQAQRESIVTSWLNHVSIAYIARTEGVSEDAVREVIAKAARQPKRHLCLKATH